MATTQDTKALVAMRASVATMRRDVAAAMAALSDTLDRIDTMETVLGLALRAEREHQQSNQPHEKE